jgi:hypothetical protein
MTTKSQEAFENWWGAPPIKIELMEDRSAEVLTSMWVWQSWEAAEAYGRKKALEDVVNGFAKQKGWTQDMAYVVVQYAAAEGALK